jgi:predicted dehydrogenase
MSVRFGVIGVGYLGRHHARVYSELSRERRDITLAAVADADIGRADEIASGCGCEAYGDYGDMLDKVDAVSIVAPTTMHYEIAMRCIKAGKDILIEKPVTASVEDADELIAASDKAGTIIQVGHLERFNPAILPLFSASGPLAGDIVLIEAERLSPFLGRGIDVDITLDLMIHDIDIILALLRNRPKIKDIKAAGAKVITGNIDIAKACVEFEGGAQAWMTSSRISTEKSRKLKIFQRDSYITVDYQEMELKRFFKNADQIAVENIDMQKREPLKEELKDFVECVITRRRPLVSAIEGRDALKIALEIGEKIRNEADA